MNVVNRSINDYCASHRDLHEDHVCAYLEEFHPRKIPIYLHLKNNVSKHKYALCYFDQDTHSCIVDWCKAKKIEILDARFLATHQKFKSLLQAAIAEEKKNFTDLLMEERFNVDDFCKVIKHHKSTEKLKFNFFGSWKCKRKGNSITLSGEHYYPLCCQLLQISLNDESFELSVDHKETSVANIFSGFHYHVGSRKALFLLWKQMLDHFSCKPSPEKTPHIRLMIISHIDLNPVYHLFNLIKLLEGPSGIAFDFTESGRFIDGYYEGINFYASALFKSISSFLSVKGCPKAANELIGLTQSEMDIYQALGRLVALSRMHVRFFFGDILKWHIDRIFLFSSDELSKGDFSNISALDSFRISFRVALSLEDGFANLLDLQALFFGDDSFDIGSLIDNFYYTAKQKQIHTKLLKDLLKLNYNDFFQLYSREIVDLFTSHIFGFLSSTQVLFHIGVGLYNGLKVYDESLHELLDEDPNFFRNSKPYSEESRSHKNDIYAYFNSLSLSIKGMDNPSYRKFIINNIFISQNSSGQIVILNKYKWIKDFINSASIDAVKNFVISSTGGLDFERKICIYFQLKECGKDIVFDAKHCNIYLSRSYFLYDNDAINKVSPANMSGEVEKKVIEGFKKRLSSVL